MAVDRRKNKRRQGLAHIVRVIPVAIVLVCLVIFYIQIQKLDKTVNEADQKLTSLQQQLHIYEMNSEGNGWGAPLKPAGNKPQQNVLWSEQNGNGQNETVESGQNGDGQEETVESKQNGDGQEETMESGQNGDGQNETVESGQNGDGQEEIVESEQNVDGQDETEQSQEAEPEIVPEAAHKVYLTFDDGPSKNTLEILDVLDRYDVKATFFVVGQKAEENPELIQEIVNRGHTLGMHSYEHDYETLYQSKEAFAADLMKIQNCLYGITGVMSNIYRFPGGSSNVISPTDMQIFVDYLKEQQIYFFDWNISSGDGGSVILDADAIVENCTENQGITKRGTSIILLHDATIKDTTVEALPELIETIQEMEDTQLLPITENTTAVQHIQSQE